jgi:spermidine synthase
VPDPRTRPTRAPYLVFAVFFASGATGLIYEVLWTRLLTVRVFGSTVEGVSTVLAAFMAGLALGAYVLGRRADAVRRPLWLYAALEAGVGAYAACFPLILNAIVSVYLLVARGREPSAGLAVLRFGLAFASLLVPTTLMGATLPAMSRFVAHATARLGRDLGYVYAANTAGAVLGTLLTAFLLVRALGVTATLFVTAGVNMLLALIAFRLGRGPVPASEPESPPDAVVPPPSPSDWDVRAARASVLVFGISGFCALAYEVLWTRILVFVVGSTTYAFATMLAAFLLGIAVGSAVLGRIADRARDLALTLGVVQALIGIAGTVLLPAFGEVYAVARAVGVGGRALVFVLLVCLMFAPTFLMGGTFPLVARLTRGGVAGLARTVGGIYAVNTLGAIVGSLAAGFLIIPLVGIRNGVLTVALGNAAAAALVLFHARRAGLAQRVAPVVAGVAVPGAMLFLSPPTPFILKSAIYDVQYGRHRGDVRVLFYDEGAEGTVTVLGEEDDACCLYVDTNEAANDSRWDAPSHRTIAHVPLLLHPAPKRALVVGFGMGRTSNSILQHGVPVDAVEIAPGVVRAARRYFSHVNNNVLDSPRLRTVINDGRNYILTTDRRYDMISTGIIHPLVSSGSSSIYSRDFYELCRSILTEDGVMSQWVPLHRLPVAEFRTIIRTFVSVFPETSVWFKFTPDFLILAGTRHPQRIDAAAWMQRAGQPRVDADLASDDLDALSLLDSFFMGPEATRAFAGAGPLHTDDRPILEFFGPGLGGVTTTQSANLSAMLPYRESVWPYLTNTGDAERSTALRDTLERYSNASAALLLGQVQFAALDYDGALAHYQQAFARNPDDPTIAYHLAETTRLVRAELDEQIAGTERALKAQIARDPNDYQALVNLGLVYRNAERLDDAAHYLERAVRLRREAVEGYLLLGEVYERKGDLSRAIGAYESAGRLAPDQAVIYGSLAALYQQAGRLDDAIRAAREVLRIVPDLPLAYSTLGSLYLAKGDLAAAAQSYERALENRPDANVAAAAWNGLGEVRAAQGRYAGAVEAFENALRADPDLAEAKENLRRLRARVRP